MSESSYIHLIEYPAILSLFVGHKILTFPCLYIVQLIINLFTLSNVEKHFEKSITTILDISLFSYPIHKTSVFGGRPLYMGLYSHLPATYKHNKLLVSEAFYKIAEF